jgi:hypothetical protein
MWDALAYFGLFMIFSTLVGVLAKAARYSGLQEFTLMRFRFKGNEKPPKQLKE